MEKSQHTPFDDVGQETYQGPSAHIVALGTGVVKHLKWAIIGLGLGAGYAMIDPKHTGKLIGRARLFARDLKKDEAVLATNIFVKWGQDIKYTFGGLIHLIVGDDKMATVLREACKNGGCGEEAGLKTAEWFSDAAMSKEQGFGNFFLSHTFGALPIIGKKVKQGLHTFTETVVDGKTVANDSRLTNALSFGGAVAAGGYVSGWLVALFTGSHRGNKGRHQFERAKDQIQTLQEDNGDLTRINEELRKKYITAATRLDTIAASQADAARSETPATPDTAPLQDAAPLLQLTAAQHQGKLAQPELAVA